MATSMVARGKIIKAAQEGLAIGSGWALDEAGRPTGTAADALKGCILPMGGHKGAALAMIIEVLAGLMTGAAYGKDVIWQYSGSSEPSNVGHLFIALNISGFINIQEFQTRMDNMVDDLKTMKKAYGFEEIRMPGEKSRRSVAINKKEGIEVSEELLEKLTKDAVELDVELPSPINEMTV